MIEAILKISYPLMRRRSSECFIDFTAFLIILITLAVTEECAVIDHNTHWFVHSQLWANCSLKTASLFMYFIWRRTYEYGSTRRQMHELLHNVIRYRDCFFVAGESQPVGVFLTQWKATSFRYRNSTFT